MLEEVRNLQESTTRATASDEALLVKLQREASVVFGGAGDGIGRSVDAALEKPGETAAKVALSAALGAGLAFLQTRTGMVGLVGQTTAAAFGFSLVSDLLPRVGDVGGAMSAAWQSGESLAANRESVAGAAGPFAVDFALTGLGGALGVAGARGLSNTLRLRSAVPEKVFPRSQSADTPAARAIADPAKSPVLDHDSIHAAGRPELVDRYWDTWPSMLKIHKLSAEGDAFGSGFIVSESGHAVTNFHVIAKARDIQVLRADGTTYRAAVVKVDPGADLALIKLDNRAYRKIDGRMQLVTERLDALNLSEHSADPPVGSRLFGFGYNNQHKDLAMAMGTLARVVDGKIKIERMPAPLHPDQTVFHSKLMTKPGFSGGPVLDETGRVVAVNFAGNESGDGYGIPVSAIRRLMAGGPQRGSESYWRGAVPMIGSAQSRIKDVEGGFTSELSNLYAAVRPGLIKLQGVGEPGGPLTYGTGFLVGADGHLLTSAQFAGSTRYIHAARDGMWSLPLSVEKVMPDLGVAVLKLSPWHLRDLSARPLPVPSGETRLTAGQKLVSFGFPRASMELHATVGDFQRHALERAPGNRGKETTVLALQSSMPSESGFEGAPLINRSGQMVGLITAPGEGKAPQKAISLRTLADALRSAGIKL